MSGEYRRARGRQLLGSLADTQHNVAQQNLLEYIKHAIELESDIVTQNGVISEYIKLHNEKKPKLEKLTLAEVPQYPTGIADLPEVMFLVLFGVSACIGLLIGVISMAVEGEFVVCFVYGIGALIFGWIPCYFLGAQKEDRLNYKSAMERYQENKKAITQKNLEREENYAKQIKLWTDAQETSLQYMNEPLNETSQALASLYSLDIIYPKYRNLPALTSIYEYFVTGRCEELSGPYGAYNLYEDEVRKDMVISQLNAVIENLEQIRQNQFMLYEEVRAIRSTTYEITQELKQIKGYTAVCAEMSVLSAYYAKVNARNTGAIAYYHFMR